MGMPRKKTEEEYVNQLKIKSPDIELVGNYINDHTKVAHYCKIHHITWDISPNKVLQGHGCFYCGCEKRDNKRRKPEEKYIEELAGKNPHIKLKGKYINTNTPVEHYCQDHDISFNIRPSDALYGKGCKQCKSDKIRGKLQKPEDQYIEELAIKNPTIKLNGKYKGTDVPTSHYCIIHDFVWDARPSNILHGNGCPQCRTEKIGNALRKLENDYIFELLEKNSNIKLREQYINYNTPVGHYCEKHNVLFNMSPNCALQGHGCPQCASERLSHALTKSEEQYVADLQKVHNNIILCGEYVGGHINTPHKCLICGCEWSPRPSNLLSGYGCPSCNTSKGEKQISMWLKRYNIIYVPQKRFDDCRDKNTLPFDFYLPDYNICVEYQGMQHYEPIDYFGGESQLSYIQYHDKIKSEYCKTNNITLICISYLDNIDDFLNNNLLI